MRDTVEENVTGGIEKNNARYAANAILCRQGFGRFIIHIQLLKIYIGKFGLCCAKHGRKSFTRPSPLRPEFKYFLDPGRSCRLSSTGCRERDGCCATTTATARSRPRQLSQTSGCHGGQTRIATGDHPLKFGAGLVEMTNGLLTKSYVVMHQSIVRIAGLNSLQSSQSPGIFTAVVVIDCILKGRRGESSCNRQIAGQKSPQQFYFYRTPTTLHS